MGHYGKGFGMEGISVSRMRELDSKAVAAGTPVLELMERAGRECAKFIGGEFGEGKRILVFCGPGNNGGDGLVCARYLHKGNSVRICVVGEPKTPAAKGNLLRAKKAGVGIIAFGGDGEGAVAAGEAKADWKAALKELGEELKSADMVVDALLGVGAKLPLRGKMLDACRLINSSAGFAKPPKIVSIDVPTGMDADTGKTDYDAVAPDITICMHAPKIGELKAGERKTGRLVVADIGLGG
ncbi:NAD(P)H-hydrate epimerase [Candidatus Micrarchaeota archaeon]|nr:NAD(P)H-hydrate epimerase [Candidatus Micrarchaeota archaeon]